MKNLDLESHKGRYTRTGSRTPMQWNKKKDVIINPRKKPSKTTFKVAGAKDEETTLLSSGKVKIKADKGVFDIEMGSSGYTIVEF